MIPLIADREMRETLARLELISHGSTTAWNPSGGHNTSDQPSPPGEAHPPHLHYRHAWLRATTDEQRARVKRDAHAALSQLTRRTEPIPDSPPQDARDMRLLSEEFHDVAPELVAEAFTGLTAAMVRRRRTAHGLDAETGTRPDGNTLKGLPLDVRLDRARRMLAGGCTIRQAAFACGLGRGTVERLRKAA